MGPADFCQGGVLDAARFLGGLGFVEVGEVGVVDGACFSGGVDGKRAPVAANAVTSASETMPVDSETSACSEDVTSPRFKEAAVQCDILHETSMGKGRLRLDIILPRFFLAPLTGYLM